MPGCDFGWVSPTVGGYCVGEGSGVAPTDLGDSAFDDIAESAAEGASATVGALGSAWTSLESPALSPDSGPVAFLSGSTWWFTAFTAVLCLLVAAGHLAWQRRGEPARQALRGLLNLVVVSSAGVAAVNLLTVAGDRFSVWIIDRSTGCAQLSPDGEPVERCVTEFDERVTAMLALGGTDSSFLVLLLALLVICASLAQVALLIVRVAMLVILAGTLPLSAAASSTAAGRTWFRRCVGWLLAFVLYKPAAAVVYASAFAMTGSTGDGAGDAAGAEIVSMVSGVVLLVLACFTLPALLRLAAPAVQLAASRAGRGARAAAGGPPTVATGAHAVPQLRGPAAGRSVSGATVSRGATSAAGPRQARAVPSRGPNGGPSSGPNGAPGGASGGENPATAASTATTATTAGRRRPDRAARAAPPGEEPAPDADSGTEQPARSAPARQHHDDQQEEPRVGH